MTLSRKLMDLISGAAYIPAPLADYHRVQDVKAAARKRNAVERWSAIRVALKAYRVMVTMQGEQTRIYNPSTGAEIVL